MPYAWYIKTIIMFKQKHIERFEIVYVIPSGLRKANPEGMELL
ncbi:MAG: hypothetical protein Q8S01_12325 [Ignavibacteria bacterium]|nr:hypothetical protein [Ignavibacteria bacterium]